MIDKVLDNDFAFLTLLMGMLMIASGIIFKFFPPNKLRWYNSIPLKSVWQDNEVVQREAMRWTIKPSIILGIFFTGLGLLSLAHPASTLFTFRSSIFIILVCCFLGIQLRNRNLNRLFNEDHNSSRNA